MLVPCDYRGYDQFNFPAFHAAQKRLEQLGYEVWSPAKHDEQNGFDASKNSLDGFDMARAFRWDISSVLDCEMVVALPGWEQSHGASLEVGVARMIGTPVAFYRDGVLEEASTQSVTREAERIVNGPRQANYGHPWVDLSRSAKMFEAILGTDVTPEQVALCMMAVKISRLCNHPGHRDSMVDVAGYAAVYELIAEKRKEMSQ